VIGIPLNGLGTEVIIETDQADWMVTGCTTGPSVRCNSSRPPGRSIEQMAIAMGAASPNYSDSYLASMLTLEAVYASGEPGIGVPNVSTAPPPTVRPTPPPVDPGPPLGLPKPWKPSVRPTPTTAPTPAISPTTSATASPIPTCQTASPSVSPTVTGSNTATPGAFGQRIADCDG